MNFFCLDDPLPNPARKRVVPEPDPEPATSSGACICDQCNFDEFSIEER